MLDDDQTALARVHNALVAAQQTFRLATWSLDCTFTPSTFAVPRVSTSALESEKIDNGGGAKLTRTPHSELSDLFAHMAEQCLPSLIVHFGLKLVPVLEGHRSLTRRPGADFID